MEIESTEATGARDWASDRSQTNGARRGAESFRGCCQTTHWHSVRSPFLKRKSKSRLTTSSQLVVDRAIIWWKSVESCQFDSTGNSLLFFFCVFGALWKEKTSLQVYNKKNMVLVVCFSTGRSVGSFQPCTRSRTTMRLNLTSKSQCRLHHPSAMMTAAVQNRPLLQTKMTTIQFSIKYKTSWKMPFFSFSKFHWAFFYDWCRSLLLLLPSFV